MTRQKAIRNLCLGLFFFLSGIEYAVILPTLNGYLKSLDAEQAFLGIVMSAFSFSGLVAAPIYGRITDKTRSIKICVIVSNLFEIIGNCLYMVSWNKYIVLTARLVAGVGSGVASSIFGTISRTTSEEERTGIFSLFMSLRQVGLIVGPAFNLFLHSLDFKIGRVTVNEYTSPGLLMAAIWLLHTIIVIILYKDIERKPQPGVTSYEEISSGEPRSRSRTRSFFGDHEPRTFVNEFLREEVIVCLTATFLVMFSQTGIETAATPMTLLFFEWSSLENSYLFCGASVVVVISFFVLNRLSKRFSDRAMMLSGCIGMVINYGSSTAYTLVYYFGHYSATPGWVLPMFIFNVALLTVSVPFLWVPQASLFSKVTSAQTQSFNQGIRMAAMGLGQILGPIWASSLVSPKGLPIMSFVDFLFMVMITTMAILSYKKLQPQPRRGHHSNSTPNNHRNGDNERTKSEETAPLPKNEENHRIN